MSENRRKQEIRQRPVLQDDVTLSIVEKSLNEMADDAEPGKIQCEATLLDESLLSMEKLDRTSPELWPEQIPGVSEFASYSKTTNSSPQPWTKGLDNNDLNLLNHLSSLTATEMIAEVKKLHDIAYQLGREEAKEMTRGKYLNILPRRRR
ncbi:protein lin-52 homolog [Bacillus rossius redtenbacheri]|uniref:protein lin-52 homolog n=1 Tax=Bacillus rossius redtenbacheri TaxID=93214 RepID=UPI002FDE39F8